MPSERTIASIRLQGLREQSIITRGVEFYSPGFLPDGSSVWFFDQDRDDGTTVRTWMTWCHGTPEQPQPCGTERNWAWGELGTVAP